MYYNTRIEITLFEDDIKRLENPDLGIVKKGDITVMKGVPRKDREIKKGK